MALAVIGAGFGRTGTESMKIALETLGLGPCHHMKEVLSNPGQLEIWRAIARGEKPDWDLAFAGYRSSVDWPSTFFWRELSRFYPQAKVILTVRSSESWYKSISSTIFEVLDASTDPDSIGLTLIAKRVFHGRCRDRDHAIAVYEKNNSDVQAEFGPDRLLTYQLGDGWEPLCKFLDRPVPAEPFPRSNSASDFAAFMKKTD